MAFLVDFTQTTAVDICPQLIEVDGPPRDIYVALRTAIRNNGMRYSGGGMYSAPGTVPDGYLVALGLVGSLGSEIPDSVAARLPDSGSFVWKVAPGRYTAYSSAVHWHIPDMRFRAFDFTVWVPPVHPSTSSNIGFGMNEARVTINAFWMNRLTNPADTLQSTPARTQPTECQHPSNGYTFEPDRPQE